MHRHQKMLVALLAAGVTAIPVVATASVAASPESAKTTLHQDGGFKGMG